MYECQYRIYKNSDEDYEVTYSLKNENRNLVETGKVPYQPMHGPLNSMNKAKARIAQALNMRLKYAHQEIDKIKMICLNPKSDFLSRSEMYWLNRGVEKKVETETKPCTVAATEQIYEVVQVVTPNGAVWTIKKHTEPYYTETEAKTELFKRIVNG